MSEAGRVEAPGQASAGVDAAEAPGKPSRARRTVHILVALLVAFVLPTLLMWALVGEFAASAMFIGIVLGGVGAKLGGTRRMLVLAPLMGLAAGLGAFTAYDWWWAALLAAAAAIAGAGIGFGWFAPLLMVPYAATFVTASVFGEARRDLRCRRRDRDALRRRHHAPFRGSRRSSRASAVRCRTPPRWHSCSASPWGARRRSGLRWDGPSRTGSPSPASSCCSTSSSASENGSGKGPRYRASELPPRSPWRSSIRLHRVLATLAIIAFLLAITQTQTYWLMYGLYTFSLVLFLAAPGQVGVEAEERGLPDSRRHRAACRRSVHLSRPQPRGYRSATRNPSLHQHGESGARERRAEGGCRRGAPRPGPRLAKTSRGVGAPTAATAWALCRLMPVGVSDREAARTRTRFHTVEHDEGGPPTTYPSLFSRRCLLAHEGVASD